MFLSFLCSSFVLLVGESRLKRWRRYFQGVRRRETVLEDYLYSSYFWPVSLTFSSTFVWKIFSCDSTRFCSSEPDSSKSMVLEPPPHQRLTSIMENDGRPEVGVSHLTSGIGWPRESTCVVSTLLNRKGLHEDSKLVSTHWSFVVNIPRRLSGTFCLVTDRVVTGWGISSTWGTREQENEDEGP